MSQSFDLTGPSVTTHVQFNGADCEKVMLNGTRIWERYVTQQQVWVTSGYNGSVWVSMGTRFITGGHSYVWAGWSGTFYRWDGSWQAISSYAQTSVEYANGYKYTKGAYRGNSYYEVTKYYSSTGWIDTSSYQTQNVTAYYY